MSKGISQCEKSSAELRKMKRARRNEKFMRRARLAKRDIDYAESGCAAAVTVEERGGIRIETRGQCGIGAFAANHYTHL